MDERTEGQQEVEEDEGRESAADPNLLISMLMILDG